MISIIIPIFNMAESIERTLFYCLSQSEDKLEIIVIDDASTDNSLEKVTAFNDPRIKVIPLTKNVGTYQARKIGVMAASGENILFVDGDDILDQNCIATLMPLTNNDLVVFRYYSQSYSVILPGCNDSYIKQGNREILSVYLYAENFIDWSSAGKLFKKNLLILVYEKLAYINQRFLLAEDLVLLTAYLKYVQSFQYIPYLGYIYLENTSSIMKNTSPDIIMFKRQQYRLAMSYLKKLSTEDNDSLEYKHIYIIMELILMDELKSFEQRAEVITKKEK